jgi:hypothetical protein
MGDGRRARQHHPAVPIQCQEPFWASQQQNRKSILRAISEASAPDRGGRTHTFAVRRAGAKLKARAVYQRSDIILSHGKPISRNGNGEGRA